MEYFLRKRLPDGQDNLPTEKYLEAYAQTRTMRRYATAENRQLPAYADEPAARMNEDISAQPTVGTWQPLGPGNIGGRTRGLLIDPGNPNVMYAAGVAGGVWKTTNGGTSWTPKADLLANIAVSTLAMDPQNSSVLYAGTGEGFFNVDSVQGAGIYKSTDAGENWSLIASTGPTVNSNFLFVNDIAVSPLNSSRIYAATRQGVFRTLDGGTTWTQVLFFTASGGCTDLVMRTDQPTDYIFAACGIFTNGAIWRHTDATQSTSWTRVLGGSGQPESEMGRLSLAIAKSNQNTIYALSMRRTTGTNYTNGLHAVFRSTSSGDSGTWTARVRNTDSTKLNTMQLTNPLIAFLTECGQGTSSFLNQGWYDNVIAVDPLDENRVWTGGIDLMRSDDGGATWGLASYWWNSPPSAHADQHTILFHPGYNGTSNKIMFVANDGGVYRTDDARAAVATGAQAPCSAANTSVAWTDLNNNYGVTQFYHGLPYPGGTTYFGGTQDNGTLRSNDGAGTEGWTELRGGDGGYVAVDPANTDTVYGANPNGGFFKSTNGGATFTSATTGLTDSGFAFITPFVMDPHNAQRLWIGGFFLWRTDNAAANWTRASTLTRGSGNVSAIAVKPGDSNTVVVGMSDGFILRNTAALSATDTTEWSFSQPRTGTVSWLAFDPGNPQVVYATYSSFTGSRIYKSTDAGVTWSQGLDGTGLTGLPSIPVHSLVVDPNNSSRLYVGTDAGVFVSLDGGQTWMVENTGFANVITEALAITSVSATPNLFAFTHGRGVWRVPLNPVGSGPVLSLMTPSRNRAGAADFTVTVFGANFANNAVVRWNGSDRATSFVSSNRLTATITTADVAGTGSASVTVFNPTAGATSDALTFTIESGTNPSPSITGLSPSTVREGGGELLLTVQGSSFQNNHSASTQVRVNGQTRPSFNINAFTTMALVPASDIAAPGNVSIQLFTPGPGGGTSNTQTLTVGTSLLTMTPASLSFGNQLVNTTSASQAFTLTNNGSLATSLNNISTNSSGPGSFTRTNNCPGGGFSVPAGGSCTISFTFTPTGTGTVTATFSFTHGGFNINSPIVANLSGTGVGAGVNLSQSTVNFGNQAVSSTSATTTVVLNNGSANAITVNSIASSSNQFPMNHTCPLSPNTLAAGASCNINLTFAPTSMGDKSGTVTVTDTGSGSPRTINVSGTGTLILANFNPTSVDFGGHVSGRNTIPKSFTLTNGGNLNMTISNIAVAGNYSMSHDCPGSLAASASCTITVTFLNTAPPGAANGTVAVTSNAPGSPHTVNLTATVLNFTLSLSRPARPRRTGTGSANEPQIFDVVVHPALGAAGRVDFACEGGAPGTRCEVAPAAAELGDGPLTARVVVTVPRRGQRLRSLRSAASVKLRVTFQGASQSIELPVQ